MCNYGNILELTQKELNTLNHIFDRFKNEEVVINVQENTNCITVVGKIESIDYNYISAKLVVVSQKDKYKLLIYREFVLLADKNEFVSIFLPPNKYVSICLKSIQEKTLKESLVITKISDEK